MTERNTAVAAQTQVVGGINLDYDSEDERLECLLDDRIESQQHAVINLDDERQRERLSELLKDPANSLQHAVSQGHVRDVELLVQHGASMDGMLHHAVASQQLGVIEVLIRLGADTNVKTDLGVSPLMLAAKYGFADIALELIRHGADIDAKDSNGITALQFAILNDHVKVAARLIQAGAGVNTKNKFWMTLLMLASRDGLFDLTAELTRLGVDLNAECELGTTALMFAIRCDRAKVVAELVQLGADINAKDASGATALMFAARGGHVTLATELIQRGTDVNDSDVSGMSALSHAVQARHTEIVSILLRHSAFEQLSPSDDAVALFVAAILGNTAVLQDLIAQNVNLDFATHDGRTALHYAAEYGHTAAVQHLLDSGACVTTKSHTRGLQSQRECETPLTLAGRTGHMQTFDALVRAGAPANVRSGIDGETPLISVARAGHFPAVSLLIAHGGSGVLCFEDVEDDEHPLLLGSLATMQTMCAAVAFEFEPMCGRMMARLQTVCLVLQTQQQSQRQTYQQQTLSLQNSSAVPPADQALASSQNDALVTFACIVYRACRLLYEIEKKRSVLSRFVASRTIERRINDIDTELSNFARMHDLAIGEAVATARSSQQVDDDDDDVSDNTPLQLQQQVQTRFEQALRSNSALDISYDKDNDATAMYETAALLRHELAIRRRERSSHARESVVKKVLTRFQRVNEVMTRRLPFWFIARDDLEYHSWNLVKTENKIERYAGKWRGTNVTIETNKLSSAAFEAIVSQWHVLSHPNIVKLLGACHIGDPKLFVYESTPDDLPLHEFLRTSESNRMLKWTLLYDAALGLQHMHNRGVAHGCLQSDTIVVGSNKVARLNNIGSDRQLFTTNKRYDVHWMAPELLRGESAPSIASDIYAFGMCVCEAVTLELLWKDKEYWDVKGRVRSGVVPDCPASMSDSEWELINSMSAFDPSERVDIAHVVNQLKQFMFKHEQVGSDAISQDVSSAAAARLANLKSQRLDKHYFVELGRTIPKALRIVKMDCEELSDDEQWLSTSVLPALEFVFGLLQEREMTPADTEVEVYIAALGRLQRFVRYADSNKSVYQQMRSRKVAQAHRLVYDELDRLLNMLCVPNEHAIRIWRLEVASSIAGFEMPTALDGGDAHGSFSEAITINHLNTTPTIYEQWTRVGLTEAAMSASSSTWRPSWYLSLRELVFSDADKIGQGAFGAVYKGRWNNAQVVIKFMGYDDDLDTISTDLLLHEVRVWHRLNHPHVLKLYGACHVDKRYFVCELATGGDLVAYLNKQSDNVQLKWQMLHEAALGLQYLHSMGIAHNDLKCDNIMIGADGRAKLIDFGLSCLLGKAEIQIAVTSIGAVNWRSPEYLAGKRPSCASDVYAFAMCIIEVVSGEVPWGKHTTEFAIKHQQKKGNTMPPLPASMTAKQRNLLELMTTFEPNERVNMAFVVNKLKEIAQDEKAVGHDS